MPTMLHPCRSRESAHPHVALGATTPPLFILSPAKPSPTMTTTRSVLISAAPLLELSLCYKVELVRMRIFLTGTTVSTLLDGQQEC